MRASTLRAAVDDADRTALSNAPVDVEPELSELSEELEAAMNSSSVLVDEVAESAAVSTGETDIASAPAGASELPKSVEARADSVFLQQAEQILADDDDASSDKERRALKEKLLQLAAVTDRGQAAKYKTLREAENLAEDLECLCPTTTPARESAGTWALVFSSTQLFRSSPFFMAGRAVCADGTEARRYDAFCDLHRAALAISEIGQVRQVVSLDPPMLTSEFEVRAGAVPFLSDVLPFLRYSGGLPLTIEGSIVSSASIDTVNDDSYTLYMDTVEIKGSNVPLLRQVLDSGLRLESRNLGGLLEQNLPGYSNPKPLFRTTYVDDTMRICRDQDGKLFVYSKLSNATSTTDYSDVTADLGVGSLLSSLSLLI